MPRSLHQLSFGRQCQELQISFVEVCTRCEGLDIKSQPCISAKCIHVSSDQAPSQRKAHIKLNSVASNDVNSAKLPILWIWTLAFLQKLYFIFAPL